MNKLHYSPQLGFLCLPGIDACAGKHPSSAFSSPCGKNEGAELSPGMWGRQHRVAGAQASQPGEVSPPGREEGCLYSLLSEVAHQECRGFRWPAAVFRSAFALSTTSLEDFRAGRFIHFNEYSHSVRTWGCVCRFWTVMIEAVVEVDCNTFQYPLAMPFS